MIRVDENEQEVSLVLDFEGFHFAGQSFLDAVQDGGEISRLWRWGGLDFGQH